MTGIISVIGIGLGSAASCVARRFPMHIEAIETAAGFLLIGGLALLGATFPAVI